MPTEFVHTPRCIKLSASVRTTVPNYLRRQLSSNSTGSGPNIPKDPAAVQRMSFFRRFFSRSHSDSSTPPEDSDSNKQDKMFRRTRTELTRREQDNEKWRERKKYYDELPLEEKRSKYKGRYKVLSDIPTWTEYYEENAKHLKKLSLKSEKSDVTPNDALNSKISIWRGDITTLEIDSIVNAANESLLGGGGVDGAIHRSAGSTLVMECANLDGCQTGDAKITGGYKLPAKRVLHTVGPIGSGSKALYSCYSTCLKLMLKHELRSTAFPCISTGIYGFPNEKAAHIALGTTREFLEEHGDKVDRIIFCLFLPKDVNIYERLMQEYFPLEPRPDTEGEEYQVTSDTKSASTSRKSKVESSPAKMAKSSDSEENMSMEVESPEECNDRTRVKTQTEKVIRSAEKCKDVTKTPKQLSGATSSAQDIQSEKSSEQKRDSTQNNIETHEDVENKHIVKRESGEKSEVNSKENSSEIKSDTAGEKAKAANG